MAGKLPDDVAAQVNSTNETAKAAATAIIGFLATAAYLAVSVAGTNDEQLLLNGNVTFPILNSGVPCRLFYIFSPLLLVILHLNVLLEEYFLAHKVSRLQHLRQADRVPVEDLAQSLSALSVAVALGWRATLYVRVVVKGLFYFINILVPILLLLWMEIKFLPYHALWVSRWHRVLLSLDLVLIMMFLLYRGLNLPSVYRLSTVAGPGQAAAGVSRRRLPRTGVRGFLFPAAAVLVVVVVVWLSWWRISVPDSCAGQFDGWAVRHGLGMLHRTLEGFIAPHLNLAGRALPAKGSAAGRDLRCASFREAQLPGFDFRGAVIGGASFEGAHLPGARFSRRLGTVIASDVADPRDQEQSCDEHDLETGDGTEPGVNFENADLTDAELSYARLDRAQFKGATLLRTHFNGARANNADFTGAKGGDVVFNSACLRGATLLRADLQRSWFYGAHVDVASLIEAHLEDSKFAGASLVGSDLRFAFLQGATGLSLQAVDLRHGHLEGAKICPPPQEAHQAEIPLAMPGGADVPIGGQASSLEYSDLRDATLDSDTCIATNGKLLLYRNEQRHGPMEKLPEARTEGDFYCGLTRYLIDSHPRLAPFLARAATRPTHSSDFDIIVACGILRERERRQGSSGANARDPSDPFLGLPDELVRALGKTAVNCPVLLANPLCD